MEVGVNESLAEVHSSKSGVPWPLGSDGPVLYGGLPRDVCINIYDIKNSDSCGFSLIL